MSITPTKFLQVNIDNSSDIPTSGNNDDSNASIEVFFSYVNNTMYNLLNELVILKNVSSMLLEEHNGLVNFQDMIPLIQDIRPYTLMDLASNFNYSSPFNNTDDLYTFLNNLVNQAGLRDIASNVTYSINSNLNQEAILLDSAIKIEVSTRMLIEEIDSLLFTYFDQNQDGLLSKAELEPVYNNAYLPYKPNFDGLFNRFDTDQSGSLDSNELLEFICMFLNENAINLYENMISPAINNVPATPGANSTNANPINENSDNTNIVNIIPPANSNPSTSNTSPAFSPNSNVAGDSSSNNSSPAFSPNANLPGDNTLANNNPTPPILPNPESSDTNPATGTPSPSTLFPTGP